MTDIDKILREKIEQREAKKRRRAVIDSFRKSARRNIPMFLSYFMMALLWGLMTYLQFLQIKTTNHPGMVSLSFNFAAGLSLLHLGMALRSLYVSPRDKLLLLILDEVLENDEQTKPAE